MLIGWMTRLKFWIACSRKVWPSQEWGAPAEHACPRLTWPHLSGAGSPKLQRCHPPNHHQQHMRQTTDQEFHKIYKQRERLAETFHVESTVPRSTVRQMHCNSVFAENSEEYYRRALAIPLVNRFIAEMTSLNKTVSKLLLLVLSIICDSECNNLDIAGLIEQYSDDLSNPDVIDLELKLWKWKWSEVEKKRSSSESRKSN